MEMTPRGQIDPKRVTLISDETFRMDKNEYTYIPTYNSIINIPIRLS